MAKHKNITEGMIDNFLDKVFKKAFDQNYDSAMKAVKKQDPELAKDMAKVDDIIDNCHRHLVLAERLLESLTYEIQELQE